jgi:hypothetical protein
MIHCGTPIIPVSGARRYGEACVLLLFSIPASLTGQFSLRVGDPGVAKWQSFRRLLEF